MTEEGEAVQIVIPKGDHIFELNTEALESILLQDDVKNKYVVVICVAGAFRKGKSFLLGFLLRYLSSKGTENWMGAMDQPLKGFCWKASEDRITTGILMWSKPFIEELPSGQEVAVLLMDTQGTFDTSNTEKENCSIFALSAMLSSIIIYNISNTISELDLLYLQRFAEYGKHALEDNITPFQKLVFLVRDYPLASCWGGAGGNALLAKRMEAEKEEHQIVRNLIKSSFSEISCFLMPHPGKTVTSKEDFDGKLQDIDEDFRDHLKTFVSDLLSSRNLIVKSISGNKVTGKNLLEYFRRYMKIFSSEAVPTPTNILLGLIESDNYVALTDARELYLEKMRGLSDSIFANDGFDNKEHGLKLEDLHTKTKMEALHLFDGKRKTGGDEYSKKYREALIEYIDSRYTHLIQQLKNQNALQTSVQQIQSGCQKDMDKEYGIGKPYANNDELESIYSNLEAQGNKQFKATTEVLNDAASLIQHYQDKLNKGMQDIYDYYMVLNNEKSVMEQMVKETFREYKDQMEQQFTPDSDALPESEFWQRLMQIRLNTLKKFDSNVSRYRKELICIYREKLKEEIQDCVAHYVEENSQKLICERRLEELLFARMAFRNNGMSVMQKLWNFVGFGGSPKPNVDEGFLREAERSFREYVGRSSYRNVYTRRLREKIKKWSMYEDAVSSAKSVYETEMKSRINGTYGQVSMEKVDEYHRDSTKIAVDSLKSEKHKLGEKEFIGYALQLEHELDYLYLYYKGCNDSKSKCSIM